MESASALVGAALVGDENHQPNDSAKLDFVTKRPGVFGAIDHKTDYDLSQSLKQACEYINTITALDGAAAKDLGLSDLFQIVATVAVIFQQFPLPAILAGLDPDNARVWESLAHPQKGVRRPCLVGAIMHELFKNKERAEVVPAGIKP